jgi:AcrR family transcriptional regulator
MLHSVAIDQSITEAVLVGVGSGAVGSGTDVGIAAALPSSLVADGTRARLLRAGLELFAQRGYHGTSIRDIAAAAGVQSATLYGHFASKEELLAELVVRGHEEHHRRLVDALMDAGSDPRDQLRALVTAHVDGHASFPLLATVANAELARLSPEAAAPAHLLRAKSVELLSTVLARGVRQRVFTVENLEVTINAISAMGQNVASWYPARAAEIDIDVLCASLSDLALRVVQPSLSS